MINNKYKILLKNNFKSIIFWFLLLRTNTFRLLLIWNKMLKNKCYCFLFLSKLLIYFILASLISWVSIALYLLVKISKIHIFLFLIKYYYYYQIDHGNKFVSHGQYNTLVLGIIVFWYYFNCKCFFYLSEKCVKKGYSYIILYYQFVFLFFLYRYD